MKNYLVHVLFLSSKGKAKHEWLLKENNHHKVKIQHLSPNKSKDFKAIGKQDISYQNRHSKEI